MERSRWEVERGAEKEIWGGGGRMGFCWRGLSPENPAHLDTREDEGNKRETRKRRRKRRGGNGGQERECRRDNNRVGLLRI